MPALRLKPKNRLFPPELERYLNLLIVVLDARAPVTTFLSIPQFSGRDLIFLNRQDLASAMETERWVSAIRRILADHELRTAKGGSPTADAGPILDSRSLSLAQRLPLGCFAGCATRAARGGDTGLKPLTEFLMREKERLQRESRRRGILSRDLKIAVVGRPNVGKSTLINSLVAQRVTRVGPQPGITKGYQWLTHRPGILILDTPGIWNPGTKNKRSSVTAVILSLAPLMKELAVPVWEMLISSLDSDGMQKLKALYGIPSKESSPALLHPTDLLEQVMNRSKGASQAGGRDEAGVVGKALAAFNKGRLGRITFEKVETHLSTLEALLSARSTISKRASSER